MYLDYTHINRNYIQLAVLSTFPSNKINRKQRKFLRQTSRTKSIPVAPTFLV